MPSKELLNMLLGLKEIQQRQQQIDLARMQQQQSEAQQHVANRQAGLSTFQALLPNIRNPKQLNKAIGLISDNFDIARESLQEIGDNWLQDTSHQQAGLSQSAIDRAQAGGSIAGETPQYAQLSNATGASTLAGTNPSGMAMSNLLAQLVPTADKVPVGTGVTMAMKAATGMTPGEQAIDTATAHQPESVLQQGARIKMGIEPSADNLLTARIQQQAQALQRELGFANIGQAYDQLAQNYGLQMLELAQKGDAAGAENAAKAMAAATEQQKLALQWTQEAGKPHTEAERKIIAEGLKSSVPSFPSLQQHLRQSGQTSPQQQFNPIFPGDKQPINYLDQRSWGKYFIGQ